jgi:uncharacterized RDD family membrane protein YckC
MPPPPGSPPPYGEGAPPAYGSAPPPAYGAAPPYGYQPYQDAGSSRPYAGFGARLGALIIDGLIGALFSIPGLLALFAGPKHLAECTVNGENGICNVPDNSTILAAVALFVALGLAYGIIYCRRAGHGQSWGQQACNVRVVDAQTGQPIGAWRTFGRQAARILSGAVCYLGYLWMLWDGRKQTWHDKLVGSIVVRS